MPHRHGAEGHKTKTDTAVVHKQGTSTKPPSQAQLCMESRSLTCTYEDMHRHAQTQTQTCTDTDMHIHSQCPWNQIDMDTGNKARICVGRNTTRQQERPYLSDSFSVSLSLLSERCILHGFLYCLLLCPATHQIHGAKSASSLCHIWHDMQQSIDPAAYRDCDTFLEVVPLSITWLALCLEHEQCGGQQQNHKHSMQFPLADT